MQFSSVQTLLIMATIMKKVSAEEILSALFDDMSANVYDYYNYALTADTSALQPYLDLYNQGYLTADVSSKYEMLTKAGMSSELSSFATGLPWYSSRILPQLDDKDESDGSSAKTGGSGSSVPSETGSSGSSAPIKTTSSGKSSSVESGSVTTSESSALSKSSTSSSSSQSSINTQSSSGTACPGYNTDLLGSLALGVPALVGLVLL
ncbi:unnamed protein product [Ambrosiozyma monospora]|uniref:Unnamed protein product n=1 Tax=Ambrosiozyma monospora TaxID=43982 RepID=A0ACB5T9Q3_AMBMO|nr:unnamed protein product [Ambrosiozyma monospora]